MQPEPFFGVRPAAWLGDDDPAGQIQMTVEWAVTAESLGYDIFLVADRLLATAHSGEGLAVYEATMIDPFVMLAAVGARTTRIRLGPLVAVVPFRHPASMAKLTASLDVLSDGRLVFGAGAGWSAPELRMFGIDRRRRGDQMEEGINLIRQLWRGEGVTCHGQFWDLDAVRVLPRPVQSPGPPVWIGSFGPDDAAIWDGYMTGAQTRALGRIGRIADGWVPLTYSAGHKRQLHSAQLAQGWDIISRAADAAGRKPADIDIVYSHWIAIVRDAAERRACERGLQRFFPGSYEDAKATYLIGTPGEIADRICRQVSGLERVDGYLFTPINDEPEQLAAIVTELRPLLRQR